MSKTCNRIPDKKKTLYEYKSGNKSFMIGLTKVKNFFAISYNVFIFVASIIIVEI